MAAAVMIMEKKALFYNYCTCGVPVKMNYSTLNSDRVQLAKVWHVAQSWAEATEHSKFT